MSIAVNQPNFLIVGANKAGTTSLANYLAQHPNVFIPTIKEPKYFTSIALDLETKYREHDKIIDTPAAYLALFNNAGGHQAIGEASADYLYFHKQVIPLIKEKLGDVHIIISLRNPVERAYSAYMHVVRNGHEKLSFRESLDKEDERIANNCRLMWRYKGGGLYCEAVKAYMDNFSHVKVLLMDDMKKDTLGTVKELYHFLQVDPNFEPDVSSTFNKSGVPKGWAYKLFAKGSPLHTLLGPLYRPFIPKKKRLSMLNKSLEKVPMETKDHEYLLNYFKQDIACTQKLINRDLSHWLKP